MTKLPGLSEPSATLSQGNLFHALPVAAGEESFEALLTRPGALLERIVSHGQRSPAGFWYDQPRDEWVALLTGAARLSLEGEERPRELVPGDWLFLPAHRRHRVEWTDPDHPTVWLALHLEVAEPESRRSRSTSAAKSSGQGALKLNARPSRG